MKKSLLSPRAEAVCTRLFLLLFLALSVLLFCSSFTSSWVHHAWNEEAVFLEKDSWAANLALLLLGLAFLAGSLRLLRHRIAQLPMNRLALAASVLVACICVVWVRVSHTVPQADQNMITVYAGMFNDGNFEGLRRGEYVGIHQQQLGIITVLRLCGGIAPFFHLESWQLFQLFSAVATGFGFYAGYRIVACITHGWREAELVYLWIALFCVPLYFYASFVYGESSSTAFALFAGWMFLESLQAPRPQYLIGLFGGCALAVLLRTNTVIILIAFAIVLVFKLLQQPVRAHLIVGLVLLLGALSPTLLTGALYGPQIPEDSHTMPAMLFITMGTNDTATNAGWYNDYNRLVYEACDFDPKAASTVARQDFAAFAAHCRTDPGYAADFYARKFGSQWNAPLYQCIAMNSRLDDTPSRPVLSLLQGTGSRILADFMNFYQLLIYGGVLLFTVLALKKNLPLENSLLLIAVFGGFLFSLLWEAKTRYVFPYFWLMIPSAAIGITAFLAYLQQKGEARHR